MPTTQNIRVSKFKAKAKSLLKSVKAGDVDALSTIRPYFKLDEFKLTQAQLVIARSYQCKSWKELTEKTDWPMCSFCQKSALEAKLMIEGGCPRGPHLQTDCILICDECIDDCANFKKDRLGA